MKEKIKENTKKKITVKLKDEKGLTILNTVILMLLIFILTIGGLYLFKELSNKQENETLKTDILLVQAKINKISNEYILNKKEENLRGVKINEIQEDIEIKEFLDKKIIDVNDKDKKYYVLQDEDLKEFGMKENHIKNNKYIVEYSEAKIYFVNGIEDGGNIYYELNEIEKKEEEK